MDGVVTVLRRVGELPEPARPGPRPGASYVAKDVREFCRSATYDVAEVSYEGRSAKNVTAALKAYIRRHPDACRGVRAVSRGGRAYLEREATR